MKAGAARAGILPLIKTNRFDPTKKYLRGCKADFPHENIELKY